MSQSLSESLESTDEQIPCYVPGRILGSETQFIKEHFPHVQNGIDLPILDPTEENLPTQKPVEINQEEPAEEHLPEWKPVEESLNGDGYE